MCDLRVGTFQTNVKDPMNGGTHSTALTLVPGTEELSEVWDAWAYYSINKTSIHVADNMEMAFAQL